MALGSPNKENDDDTHAIAGSPFTCIPTYPTKLYHEKQKMINLRLSRAKTIAGGPRSFSSPLGQERN
eukprot:scaffold2052_cov159-Amphora_coffeaeformis.AAC.1